MDFEYILSLTEEDINELMDDISESGLTEHVGLTWIIRCECHLGAYWNTTSSSCEALYASSYVGHGPLTTACYSDNGRAWCVNYCRNSSTTNRSRCWYARHSCTR